MDQKLNRKRTGGGWTAGNPQGERDVSPQSGSGRFSRFFGYFPSFQQIKVSQNAHFLSKTLMQCTFLTRVDHLWILWAPTCLLYVFFTFTPSNAALTATVHFGLFLGLIKKLKHAKHSFSARNTHSSTLLARVDHLWINGAPNYRLYKFYYSLPPG